MQGLWINKETSITSPAWIIQSTGAVSDYIQTRTNLCPQEKISSDASMSSLTCVWGCAEAHWPHGSTPPAMLSAWLPFGSVQDYSGSVYPSKEKPATPSLLLLPSFPFSRDQLIQVGSILSHFPFQTDNFTQNWVLRVPETSLLQRPRTITPADGPGMQSNFSNRYNFLMPLSVSVFSQRLMMPLRKPWQISSIKSHSTLLTNSILYNTSCSLSSQHLTQLQLQRAPGILDSPKPLNIPVPLGKVTWICLEAMDCYHKLSCQLHLLEEGHTDSSLSERTLNFHFSHSFTPSRPGVFFCLRNPIATAWVCYRICFSLHQQSSALSQYGADMMLHNGQKDEHHANAWVILSALLGSCTHRST